MALSGVLLSLQAFWDALAAFGKLDLVGQYFVLGDYHSEWLGIWCLVYIEVLCMLLGRLGVRFEL